MRGRNRVLKVLAIACAMVAPAYGASLRAQATKPQTAATKTPASKDLSGVWRRSQKAPDNTRKYSVFEIAMSLTTQEPPMTAWGLAKYKANKPNYGARAVSMAESNDPVLKCAPPGVPRIYLQRLGPVEFIQTSNRLLMFFEYEHFLRQIWTDGRHHPDDPQPTWMGDSIGKWDGDAMVVDTIGFNDKTWLDHVGHPHSESLHLTERLRRPSHEALTIDFTIEDSKTYTKPWTSHKVFELRPDWKIEEVVCADDANFDQLQKISESSK